MKKVLRSLIHEKFPAELRVELELLSRRRDIGNKEKQQELIILLRKYNIDDIVPLGSGTNRYAFKLDGFVIKFATDRDGKIDNFKEFKMAKRLYPYVIKVYEVSENGVMLVTEYIQPFSSFSEFYVYSDRIREILDEMSSMYLIGDVGISEDNFGNWGTRIGTREPVCLDFAYVYEISSEFFICRYCQANAMLIPDDNFVNLCCSNPGCNKKYTFAEIRGRIGNDLHQQEIGDLRDEGYLLESSNVLTDLTESRSNYLMNIKTKDKDETNKHKESNITECKKFIMDKAPSEYLR